MMNRNPLLDALRMIRLDAEEAIRMVDLALRPDLHDEDAALMNAECSLRKAHKGTKEAVTERTRLKRLKL